MSVSLKQSMTAITVITRITIITAITSITVITARTAITIITTITIITIMTIITITAMITIIIVTTIFFCLPNPSGWGMLRNNGWRSMMRKVLWTANWQLWSIARLRRQSWWRNGWHLKKQARYPIAH